MSAATVAAMPPAARAAFEEARRVKLANASDLSQWGATEMQLLSFTQVAGFTAEQIANLTAAQLAALPAELMAALTPEALVRYYPRIGIDRAVVFGACVCVCDLSGAETRRAASNLPYDPRVTHVQGWGCREADRSVEIACVVSTVSPSIIPCPNIEGCKSTCGIRLRRALPNPPWPRQAAISVKVLAALPATHVAALPAVSTLLSPAQLASLPAATLAALPPEAAAAVKAMQAVKAASPTEVKGWDAYFIQNMTRAQVCVYV